MARRKRRRGSPTLYLAVLVAISLLALLLPRRWTSRLTGLTQVILPFQKAVTRSADAVAASPPGRVLGVSDPTYDQLQRRELSLQHEAAALAAKVQELEREVELLSATRLWNAGGRRLGSRGRLVPAAVVAGDVVPWRSSRSIDAGVLQGVRRGSPVVSRYFTIDRGEESGLRSGLSILLGEVLVGVVDQVSSRSARVALLSDISSGRKVRVGRRTEFGFVTANRSFWLVGRGDGLMEINDVDRREVEAGEVAVGDVAVSDPLDEVLPAAMTIGRVAEIGSDPRNPLLCTLQVRCELDERALRRVYVYDPEIETDGNAGTGP